MVRRLRRLSADCACCCRYCALLDDKGSNGKPEWSLWVVDENFELFWLTMTEGKFTEHKRFALRAPIFLCVLFFEESGAQVLITAGPRERWNKSRLSSPTLHFSNSYLAPLPSALTLPRWQEPFVAAILGELFQGHEGCV